MRRTALVLVLVFVACGRGEGDDEATDTEDGGSLPLECAGGSEDREACLAALAAECEDRTSEAQCIGEWSWTDVPVLSPLGVECRWHPDVVRVRYEADACVLEERTSLCLGGVVEDNPVDPGCDQFGAPTCDGETQTGRPKGRREGASMWLVDPVQCGRLVGFETDPDQCYGTTPAPECGCFCAQ